MKLTIELTENEVGGIKAYLLELDGENSKEAVKAFIQNIVTGTINAPQEAVSGYIESMNKIKVWLP